MTYTGLMWSSHTSRGEVTSTSAFGRASSACTPSVSPSEAPRYVLVLLDVQPCASNVKQMAQTVQQFSNNPDLRAT